MHLLSNFIALILFYFADHSIRSIMPLYITEYLGFDRTYSGFFMGVFSAGGIIAQLIAGAMADRFGKFKIYTASLFLLAAIAYFYGLAATIYTLFFVRITHGFCSGMVRTMYQPATASLADKRHLGKAIGFTGIAAMAGMMAGAPAAVKITDTFSYGIFFSAAAFLYLCASLMVSLIKVKEVAAAHAKRGINAFIETTAVIPFTALRFVHSMCHGIFLAYGIIFAREASLANSGLFITAFALGNLLFRAITGFMTDREKKWYLIMTLAYIVIIGGYIIFSAQFFIAGAFMIGIGSGMEYTAANSAVFKHTKKHALNRISATMEIVVSVGIAVGASISGWLYSGPLGRLFLSIAALYLVQIFILYAYTSRKNAWRNLKGGWIDE